jgi:hypothetical protein
MKKKTIGIFFVFILLIPVQSVIGDSQNNDECMVKNEVIGNGHDADIIAMINQVDEQLLSNYLVKLVECGPRFTGSENCTKAAYYLKNEFEKLGLDVYIDPWRYVRYGCQNVVATYHGVDPSSDYVFLIGAHYDTYSYNHFYSTSPGANDDGSGIAAMLAIANICTQYSFNHTIRFVAFSGEEEGTFGSLADAQRAYGRDENIVAVLNVDMVGYADNADDGRIINIFTNERASWISSFSAEIANKYEEYIDLVVQPILNYPCDHQSYIDYGYDAVTYVEYKPEQYIWMHTPEDSIDKVNFTYLVKVTKLVLATAAELAYRPIDVYVRIVSPYESCVYLFDHPILQLPGFNLVRTCYRGMTYIIGNAVARVAVSTDEEIDSVLFGIDGDVCEVFRDPPYEWRIKKTNYFFYSLHGKHTLSVYVTTLNGSIASDEMDIFVLG